MKTAGGALLRKLVALYGIQTWYSDSVHRRKTASSESLLAVLQALGSQVRALDDVPAALKDWHGALADRLTEPVLVAWDGRLEWMPLRIRRDSLQKRVVLGLTLEDGTGSEWDCCPGDSAVVRPLSWDKDHADVALPINSHLPQGYHHLTLEQDGIRSRTLIISAPVKAYVSDEGVPGWGAFMPLYSLHSAASWGAGDFSDMERLARWAGALGTRTVATLPLLAAFLDSPYDPSPYLPVSKLLWNEFYLDVTHVPDLAECESARSLVGSPAFSTELEAARRARLVDYRRGMAMKRKALEELSRHFFSSDSPRRTHCELFLEQHPEATDYAMFRAAAEKQKKPWHDWPARLRHGTLGPGDYDEATMQYHQYVQWLADDQMKRLAESASYSRVGLYLDLPLGAHPDGFDTWHYRNLFVDSLSVGAPPDTVFTRGQDWTFPPLHPQRVRETGYEYTIGCLRHHMRYARTLRIDHIMGLHRLFFIPRGMECGQGVYVRYHPEEMYALLSLESHRNECAIVGEDLGIVPRTVRSAMARHNLQRMWVMHYELAGHSRRLLPEPLPNQVASLNTHDMPPFASFWRGQDIADRLKTGVITSSVARRERTARAVLKRRLVAFLLEKGLPLRRVTARSVLEACLSFVAASHASLVLVNLEDLWLETRTQNIPSTTTEHPNWRRKSRYDLETFCQMEQVQSILEVVRRQRPGGQDRRVSSR